MCGTPPQLHDDASDFDLDGRVVSVFVSREIFLRQLPWPRGEEVGCSRNEQGRDECNRICDPSRCGQRSDERGNDRVTTSLVVDYLCLCICVQHRATMVDAKRTSDDHTVLAVRKHHPREPKALQNLTRGDTKPLSTGTYRMFKQLFSLCSVWLGCKGGGLQSCV